LSSDIFRYLKIGIIHISLEKERGNIWFLTTGIKELSLARIVGKCFSIFASLFGEAKEGRDIPDHYVYLCEKLEANGFISEFIS
jgi:hypothetical protein